MKTIAAVPESITRAQYVALIESLGFDTNELTHLEFRIDGIYATVKVKTETGGDKIDRTLDADGFRNEVVKERIYIPIINRPTPADWNAPPLQSATPPPDLR